MDRPSTGVELSQPLRPRPSSSSAATTARDSVRLARAPFRDVGYFQGLLRRSLPAVHHPLDTHRIRCRRSRLWPGLQPVHLPLLLRLQLRQGHNPKRLTAAVDLDQYPRHPPVGYPSEPPHLVAQPFLRRCWLHGLGFEDPWPHPTRRQIYRELARVVLRPGWSAGTSDPRRLGQGPELFEPRLPVARGLLQPVGHPGRWSDYTMARQQGA